MKAEARKAEIREELKKVLEEDISPETIEMYDRFFGTGYWEKEYRPHICTFARKHTRSRLTDILEEIEERHAEINEAIDSQKDEGLEVPEWLKGQSHAYEAVKALIQKHRDS